MEAFYSTFLLESCYYEKQKNLKEYISWLLRKRS
jgi:hypothetical protein